MAARKPISAIYAMRGSGAQSGSSSSSDQRGNRGGNNGAAAAAASSSSSSSSSKRPPSRSNNNNDNNHALWPHRVLPDGVMDPNNSRLDVTRLKFVYGQQKGCDTDDYDNVIKDLELVKKLREFFAEGVEAEEDLAR